MKILLHFITILLVAVISAACGGGHSDHAGHEHHDTDAEHANELIIKNPSARAVSPNGAVYFQIVNGTDTDDVLLKAASDVSEVVELHETIIENDVMKITPVENFPVAAGEAVELKQGGKHVMLMGLTQELEEGDQFDVTLTFEQAGDKTVTVQVMDAVGGMGHNHGDHSGHGDHSEHADDSE